MDEIDAKLAIQTQMRSGELEYVWSDEFDVEVGDSQFLDRQEKILPWKLRVFGFDILSKILGAVNAERFIALTIRDPMDYTAWREKHMYLDEDVHTLAERARAAARRFDAMDGDYTRLREGVFDGKDVASELDGRISAWKSANRKPALP